MARTATRDMEGLSMRLRELRGERLDERAAAARQARALEAHAATRARSSFSWEAFSAGVPDSVASGSREARASFREFCATARGLLGEEPAVNADEATAAIYAAVSRTAARGPPGLAPPGLGRGGGDADEGVERERRVRALVDALAPVVGASNVSRPAIERLLALHGALQSWREAHRLPPIVGGPQPGVGGTQPAFGEGWHVRPRASWVELTSHAAALAAAVAVVDAPPPAGSVRGGSGGVEGGAGAQLVSLAGGAGCAGGAASCAAEFGGAEAGDSGEYGEAQPAASVLWLRQATEAHVCRPGAPSGVDAEAVSSACLRLLLSDAADDALQNELFDLFGFEGLELSGQLLGRRAELCDSALRLCAALLGPAAAGAAAGADGGGGVGGCQGAQGGSGTGVSVTSLSAIRAERSRRKEERRVARRAGAAEGGGAALERLLGTYGLDGALQAAAEQQWRHIEQQAAAGGARPAGGGAMAQRHALPEGTLREVFETHETVSVPPPARTEAARAAALARPRAQVGLLEPLVQRVLRGVERLNPMQTAVHTCALRSSENFLVCAPTGAGKTNVALMAICQQLLAAQRAGGGAVDLSAVKIVYVAPMKALAAEVAGKLGAALQPLSLRVRELTGDMQLTKKEMAQTQVLVVTPEKWDVVTRKGAEGVAGLVGLLILDEVHLLGDSRGPVLEAIVARTLRLVESAQVQVRLLGLSATLPNYVDVGLFLRASPSSGVFYFDASYRPVPLSQQYIGVKVANPMKRVQTMLTLAYERALAAVEAGKQAMVFVHARNDTVRTARALRDLARSRGESSLLAPDEAHARYAQASRDVGRSRSADLRELFPAGLGVHHAGMLRAERSLAERLFAEGHLKVLVCTATLAWGVNLPAHTVIIKGTQIYDPSKGGHVELSSLDVMQIFGRAGRPQFDTSGEGVIITTHDKLAHYLQLLNAQLPVESALSAHLADHLNAEVCLGTVSSLAEGAVWLSYSYLYIRAMRNPLAYGIDPSFRERDPDLFSWRLSLLTGCARRLDQCRMVRFNPATGALDATELGRIASHFYLGLGTVQLFDDSAGPDADKSERRLHPLATDAELLGALACSSEFENIKARDEEGEELSELLAACPLKVKGGIDGPGGKQNVLIQTYISGLQLKASSLISDANFVAQSAGRIARGFFEIALSKGWIGLALKALTLAKMLEWRLWATSSPLRQVGGLPEEALARLEARRATREALLDMSDAEAGALVAHPRLGASVRSAARRLPALNVELVAKPITRTVLRIELTLCADFEWSERCHGAVQPWYIWVEDFEDEHVYHKERFVLLRAKALEPQLVAFTIPLFEPLPAQYLVRVVSETWLGAESVLPLPLHSLALPAAGPTHTPLLPLRPLPRAALANARFERLFRFAHFNPVQTQLFHATYHTDENVLVGAPTGSGKTVTAELAVLRLLAAHPGKKAVYIAPLKALVRERMADWGRKLAAPLGLRLVELTGDVSPDMHALRTADVLCTTPEKWDSVSRGWQSRGYVRDVGLVVIDEVHLLGEERGPVLEVIVSRMRFISTQATGGDAAVRFVALTSSLANAHDLADWLGVGERGLFNFKPSVRPVPLEVHISGHAGKHYCPRMAAMNRPTYRAIIQHAPDKPTLVFVSSRRQTRLTALDLISYCSADDRASQFVNMEHEQLERALGGVRDPALRHTLAFGIGIHHAGLGESDRTLVEELFVHGRILVLVSTSTLAWGVNFPAHLVVVKGTEFYDGKQKRYVDMPITDVLQMMGRAGRPQYDDHGVAVILVHEPKKQFYRKFLYEPFPVESCLQTALHDHLNAEIAGGAIGSKQDAVDWLTWTFFYRRLKHNPAYYGLEDGSAACLSEHLSALVDATVSDLEAAGCVALSEDGLALEARPLGSVAAFYYLKHSTVAHFHAQLGAPPGLDSGGRELAPLEHDLPSLLAVLCGAAEFGELPVRHNEDQLNAELALACPLPVDAAALDAPEVKASLLLQAHICRAALPISDYVTDTKGVLDQAARVLQAMVDIAADAGSLGNTLGAMALCQSLCQAAWPGSPQLETLPHVSKEVAAAVGAKAGGRCAFLAQLAEMSDEELGRAFSPHLAERERRDVLRVLRSFPLVDVRPLLQKAAAAAGGAASAAAHGALLLEPDADGVLAVELSRVNRPPERKVYAPRWPKPKGEGWWLVLAEGNELLALKRVAIGRSTRVELQLVAPAEPGEYVFTLYLVSDCYIGFDQQRDVPVIVR